MLGFSRFTGEWQTTEIGVNKIFIEYKYFLRSGAPLLYPLNWLFAELFWKAYVKRVLSNVKQMIYDNEPYKYA